MCAEVLLQPMPVQRTGFALAAASTTASVSGDELNLPLGFPAHLLDTKSEPRVF